MVKPHDKPSLHGLTAMGGGSAPPPVVKPQAKPEDPSKALKYAGKVGSIPQLALLAALAGMK